MKDSPSGPVSESHVNELARLLNDRQLVLFVGAGLSRQAKRIDGAPGKLPLWQELAKLVATECGYDAKNFNDSFDLFDSIASEVSRSRLEEAVRKAIPVDEFVPSPAHHELCKLGWYIIVTTNYDSLLTRLVSSRDPIVTESEYEWLSRDEVNRPRIVHLHGTLANPHTLTGSDYRCWQDQHPRAYSLLQSVAVSKTILFVGYSLSEPYFKFNLLPWLQQAVGSKGKRHYAWMWEAGPEQIRLFDRRDSISVTPIRENHEWEGAFRQLSEVSESLRKSKRRPKRGLTKKSERVRSSSSEAIINGYKLFFYRNKAKVSIRALGHKTGVDPRTINKLEQVKKKVDAGPACFKAIDRNSLASIEKELNCIGKLEYGQPDDFLAKYIMFYNVNTTVARKKNLTKQFDFCPDTKAVVFDFGGTLTLSSTNRSTWERMWESVGYTSHEAGHHHRRYLSGLISHQEWCDVTAVELRKRGFSRVHLEEITSSINPIEGLKEAIETLTKQGTAIYIVSGSVREIGRAHV